jgi:hypothetical protein
LPQPCEAGWPQSRRIKTHGYVFASELVASASYFGPSLLSERVGLSGRWQRAVSCARLFYSCDVDFGIRSAAIRVLSCQSARRARRSKNTRHLLRLCGDRDISDDFSTILRLPTRPVHQSTRANTPADASVFITFDTTRPPSLAKQLLHWFWAPAYDGCRPKRGGRDTPTRPPNLCGTLYRGLADRSSTVKATSGIWRSVGVRVRMLRIASDSRVSVQQATA